MAHNSCVWLDANRFVRRFHLVLRNSVIFHPDWYGKAAYFRSAIGFHKSTFRYGWHVVSEDGVQPEPNGQYIAGVDLGEIDPAVVTDGVEACVM